MISKLSLVEEEADESMYWLELLGESGIVEAERLKGMHDEMNEIVALIVSSKKTLKASL